MQKLGKPMKILVVHEVSYTKKPVYEFQDFAERLAARGHEVTVADLDEESNGAPRVRKVSRTGLGEVTLDSVPFVNLPIIKHLSARRNYTHWLRQKLERKEIDVVFLYSVFVNGTETVRLCRKYGVRVVYRVLDVYHKLRESLFIMAPLYLGEKYIYRNADVVCLTNEKMEFYVRGMCAPRAPRAVSVVHHGVDMDFFRARPRDVDFVKKYDIQPDEKIALFLGTTYGFSGLDKIIERWDRVTARVPKARLFIVGGGDLDPKIKELIESRGLAGRVVHTGFRPYDEVPRYLSLANATFLSFEINDITRDIVPIKILQYLAARQPLLCAPLPEVQRLFPEATSGIVYEDVANADAYVDRLTDLLVNDLDARRRGEQGEGFVEKHHSIERQIDRLEAVLISS